MVSEAPVCPPVPPAVIPDQHLGSNSDFGGEVDIEEAIDRSGCSVDYYQLEDCLGEHDRDWRRCQAQARFTEEPLLLYSMYFTRTGINVFIL